MLTNRIKYGIILNILKKGDINEKIKKNMNI